MTPKKFVSALAEVSLPSVFNPWRDRCDIYDREDAAARRRLNLERILEAAVDSKVETIWIARDLGYRGGRRTGIALTDEVHLDRAGAISGGVLLSRATEGPVVAERTAAIIWRMLGQIGHPVVLWNVFPFHPHEPENSLSNRCHTKRERDATWPLLLSLLDMIQPRKIVAIGRDAHLALGEYEVEATAVRHPSYGGQTEFMSSIASLYALKSTPESSSPELPFTIETKGSFAFA